MMTDKNINYYKNSKLRERFISSDAPLSLPFFLPSSLLLFFFLFLNCSGFHGMFAKKGFSL
jgi:hypothetical protein